MGFRKEDLLDVMSEYINALDETYISEIEVEKVVNRLNHQAFKRVMETATCELLDTFIAYSKSSLDLYKRSANCFINYRLPNLTNADVTLQIPHINLGRCKGHTGAIIRNAKNKDDIIIVPNQNSKHALIRRMEIETGITDVHNLPWVLTIDEVCSRHNTQSFFGRCDYDKNISIFIDQYSAIVFSTDYDKMFDVIAKAILDPRCGISRIVGLG